MKMKFYLRGLGTGLVVAVVLMSLLSKGNKSLSDEEIKKRAAELGMVSSAVTLAENKKDNEQTPTLEESKEAEQTPSVEESKEAEQTPSVEESKEAEQTSSVEESKETEQPPSVEESKEAEQPPSVEESKEAEQPPSVEESKEAEQTSSTEESKESEQDPLKEETKEPSENTSQNELVSITVYKGNGSNTVAAYLEKAGLVENAKQYDDFLCKNGFDKKICVGVFQIPVGSTYDEIAKIITSRPN